MWSIGGHRHDEAARERQRAAWRAMPAEAKVAMIGLPLTSMLGSTALSMLPQVRDAGLGDDVHAGGMIVAVASVLAVRFTFARAIEANLAREQRQQALPGPIPAAVRQLPAMRDPGAELRRTLEQVARRDPGFSDVALAAFTRALVPRIHATPIDQARSLSPYATPLAFGEIHRRLGAGAEVICGQAQLRGLQETQHWLNASVEVRVVARGPAGVRHVGLHLTLRRSGAARSPAPVDLLAFACPACGAPVDVTHPDGACRACDTGITHGQLSWQVVDVAGPLELAWPRDDGSGPNHPSLLAPARADESLDADHRALQGRNPDAPLRAVEDLAGRAAVAWFAGWAGHDPDPALFTPDLADALRYERARLEAGALPPEGDAASADQVEWLRAGQDGWHDRADLRVVVTVGRGGAAVTQAVVVRLARSVGGERGPWRAWQILDPREVVA